MSGDLCLKSLEKLLTKASVARKAVEFCAGDPKLTSAVINSVYVELGDVQRNLHDVKELVAKLRGLHRQVCPVQFTSVYYLPQVVL